MNKVIIIGVESVDKLEIAKQIISIDDNLSIVPHFTSDQQHTIINDQYIYSLTPEVINLSYKNNALLYVITKNYISSGVTTDDFYNNDILVCNFNEYNDIPDIIFTKYDILTVWVDVSQKHNLQSDLNEVRYINDRLNDNKYLYFLNEDNNVIAQMVLKYINGTEEEKNQLLIENC